MENKSINELIYSNNTLDILRYIERVSENELIADYEFIRNWLIPKQRYKYFCLNDKEPLDYIMVMLVFATTTWPELERNLARLNLRKADTETYAKILKVRNPKWLKKLLKKLANSEFDSVLKPMLTFFYCDNIIPEKTLVNGLYYTFTRIWHREDRYDWLESYGITKIFAEKLTKIPRLIDMMKYHDSMLGGKESKARKWSDDIIYMGSHDEFRNHLITNFFESASIVAPKSGYWLASCLEGIELTCNEVKKSYPLIKVLLNSEKESARKIGLHYLPKIVSDRNFSSKDFSTSKILEESKKGLALQALSIQENLIKNRNLTESEAVSLLAPGLSNKDSEVQKKTFELITQKVKSVDCFKSIFAAKIDSVCAVLKPQITNLIGREDSRGNIELQFEELRKQSLYFSQDIQDYFAIDQMLKMAAQNEFVPALNLERPFPRTADKPIVSEPNGYYHKNPWYGLESSISSKDLDLKPISSSEAHVSEAWLMQVIFALAFKSKDSRSKATQLFIQLICEGRIDTRAIIHCMKEALSTKFTTTELHTDHDALRRMTGQSMNDVFNATQQMFSGNGSSKDYEKMMKSRVQKMAGRSVPTKEIIREVDAKVRPVRWIESFNEVVEASNYHALVIYFVLNKTSKEILSSGDSKATVKYLELFRNLCEALRKKPSLNTCSSLRGITGKGKGAKLAKELLELTYDNSPPIKDLNYQMLCTQFEYAKRFGALLN